MILLAWALLGEQRKPKDFSDCLCEVRLYIYLSLHTGLLRSYRVKFTHAHAYRVCSEETKVLQVGVWLGLINEEKGYDGDDDDVVQ